MDIHLRRLVRPLAAAFLVAAALPAPALELLRSTLDAGGGASAGGAFGLTGSIAQWDAAAEAIGGELSLRGGFWAPGAASTAVPGDETPRITRLLAPVPNPFNPKTALSFDLAADGQVSLRVYGVDGRLLRVLVDEPLAAGPHSLFWDGRNGAGVELASGIYFIQMRAPGFAAVRKAVLVR